VKNIDEIKFSGAIELPQNMRSELKDPLGFLLKNKPTERLIKKIKDDNPPLVIFVGDYCFKKAIEMDYIPDIAIIDNRTKREPVNNERTIPKAKRIQTVNSPGTISENAWNTIKETIRLQTKKSHESQPRDRLSIIIVQGEEDLLVLPATIEAPIGSFIIYGQPEEGIVLIKATMNVKNKFIELIKRMMVEKK
jgi:hypothetical protein